MRLRVALALTIRPPACSQASGSSFLQHGEGDVQTCPVCALRLLQGFIDSWTQLVVDILAAAPEAKGRLLLDMINEPDGYTFDWCACLLQHCHISLPGRDSSEGAPQALRSRKVMKEAIARLLALAGQDGKVTSVNSSVNATEYLAHVPLRCACSQ